MIRISLYLDIPEEETITDEEIGEMMEAAVVGLDNRGFVVEGVIGQKVNVEVNKVDDESIDMNETAVDTNAVVSWGEEVYE